MKVFLSVMMIFFIYACSSSPKTKLSVIIEKEIPSIPILDGSYFGDKIDIISLENVYSLSEKQKVEFLEFYNSKSLITLAPHKRVFKFLKERLTSFDYYTTTSNASESLGQNRGNCLSLAILTKSLADITGIEIAYQLVESEPVYQKEGNLVISSQHIRTVLFEPNRLNAGSFNIFPSRIIIDYFPTYNSRILRKVGEAEFFSMFYSNRAVEAMFKDNNLAYWYLKKALELKPDDSNALNIMALIHERAGYADYAEKIYVYGLEYSDKDADNEKNQYLDLLNNYHSLLIRQRRTEDAEKIALKISKRDESNPFKWISLGNEAYNERNYQKAISYFRKAKKLAPYLHDIYAGISRSQFQLGNNIGAGKSLEKALDKSHKPEIRDMYQEKINMLKTLLGKKPQVIIKSDH
jgi:Flp pilus assembly protein TadD